MKKFLWSMLLCGIFFWSAGMQTDAKEDVLIHAGVYLDEIDVSGMTREEAEQEIQNYARELSQETLTLQVEEHEVQVQLSDLGLTCSNPEIVEEALGIGKSGDIIRRFKERKELEHSNKVLELAWTVDERQVSQVIEEECVQFDVDAKDAGLVRENGSFRVIPGATGVKLNVEGSKQAVLDFMQNEWQKENGTVTLPAEVEHPRGTEEELSKVRDVLGTFSTSYATSNRNRSQNVSNGARLINGTLLYPGDTFSAYEAISPFTKANGYEMAGAYLNGKVVDSLGGGICQVSTTLYNAALLAELEIVERFPHSMIVTYVDPSADAAIAGTYKDLKFKNTTNAPIYIEAGTDSNKVITFTIYGEETRPANREVKYTSTTLGTTDPGQVIIGDAGQGIGYYHVEGAHRGVKAELYKRVYENGVEVSVEKVNTSSYMPSPRTITVGIAGDPELSAQLQAAIATQDAALVQATMADCVARMQPPE
ncbi:MAG: hypothetical protein HFI31_04440 [Lachnospiraceae bacterium]|jgi:vancomycin resistance protein YoaR|nr:hypothetical protein [Lachnospiraceae bacterium]MCI8994940.1 hypothetical protein [Lachnospiraceae bacterium]MCI9133426.1 hypothetical protein [Lachnospiraceae bacterium]